MTGSVASGLNASSVAGLLAFLDASPSPFHAVAQCCRLLEQHGFEQLRETQPWRVLPRGKYYMTRNGSSLMAFAVGGKFEGNQSAINIIAAHTDSPSLRIRPLSKRQAKDGLLQVAIETYGGGLWHTWFDRDLGIAGRIVSCNKKDGSLVERLACIDRPILRIPTLAIHLDHSVKESFSFNPERHLNPILASELMEERLAAAPERTGKPRIGETAMMHQSLLRELRSKGKERGDGEREEEEEILSADLCLYDIQKASLGGIHGEFIQSARLDDLFMVFAALQALLRSGESILDDRNIRMVALFDNEEVGSLSASGAQSNLLQGTIERILSSLSVKDHLHDLLSRSFLLSADMAHAVHPNYSEKHDECHRPAMHKGIVIKHNSNQRYATNSHSSALIKALAIKNAIPFQEFMVPNGSPCGTTIGPILSSQLGMQTTDVGAPQLSMHSIREMAGVEDLDHSIRLFKAFYEMGLTC